MTEGQPYWFQGVRPPQASPQTPLSRIIISMTRRALCEFGVREMTIPTMQRVAQQMATVIHQRPRFL
ncbi:hypothetical protein GALL_458690 [mine drainage metagenome]|uniref:Uncharacterized protein n=1 Tax=mine drainage metagenome TaxID=410659 RepID=A0A1J5PLV3_9ZZZZ